MDRLADRQDLSVAGNRAGLGGERSGLFTEAIRIIKEMRDATRVGTNGAKPRWAVWENVPGAFSSGKPKGEDFRRVLEEFVRIKEPTAEMPPMDRGGGLTQMSSWVTDGAWLTALSTCNTGESPDRWDAHNAGEESTLSQILQVNVPERYFLSAKACMGILRRAEKRGKALPPMLKKALEQQIERMSK